MKEVNYAIAEIAGQQIILEPGKKVSVPKLEVEEGEKYTANKILYIRQGEKVKIGKPYVRGVSVEAVVKEHKRADKIIVFKKKRRKGYKVKKGHRQPFCVLEVGEFKTGAKKQTKKAAPKVKPEPEEKQVEKIKESIGANKNGT